MMDRPPSRWLAMLLLFVCGMVRPAAAAETPDQAVESASIVLREVMTSPGNEIPHMLLADAKAIAIVPSVVKLGFLVGVRHGRGVLVVKDEQGKWKPPVFITLTGGSFGWQAGVQSADVVLVFRSQRSLDGLMRGKLTLGADAAVAAGPVGRQAAAATDATLSSEIYSYSRSRGLFAGVALDGSAVQTDAAWNMAYYHGTGITPGGTAYGDTVRLPASAERLLSLISAYATTAAAQNAVAADNMISPAANPTQLRQQLAASAAALNALLDDTWRDYLTVRPEMFQGAAGPTAAEIDRAVGRFEAVMARPDFQRLSERVEFRRMYDLLLAYRQQQPAAPLALPPPPLQTAP